MELGVVYQFVGLLVLIVAASALLSHGAETLAKRYGANFTGSIVLAIITTLPEYLFVIWACVKLHYDMAVGSAVGACTLLITLGYGSIILVATTRLSRRPVKLIELSKATRVDAVYLLVTAVAALGLAWEGNGFDLKDAAILIAVFSVYVGHLVKGAMHFAREGKPAPETEPRLGRALVLLLAGGVIVFLASGPFVEAMIGVAKLLRVSPVTVAIVLGPLASEMPEKLTAYITVMRDGRLAEISVSNFVGSKVNHNSLLLAVMPIVAAFQGRWNVPDVINLPFLAMTGLTVVASLSLARSRLERWQGVVFVLLYGLLVWGAFHLGPAALPSGHGG